MLVFMCHVFAMGGSECIITKCKILCGISIPYSLLSHDDILNQLVCVFVIISLNYDINNQSYSSVHIIYTPLLTINKKRGSQVKTFYFSRPVNHHISLH